MSLMISVADVVHESIVDGVGVRAVLFGAGCSHACVGCHNPQSWDINNGRQVALDYIFNELDIVANPLLRGVTFSGGDPMYQAEAFCELAKMIRVVPSANYRRKGSTMTVWCYTGYLFEDLISTHDAKYELLQNVDVLVDGRYVHELRDFRLIYRGSRNQRFIDVQASLKQGVAIDYYWDNYLDDGFYNWRMD